MVQRGTRPAIKDKPRQRCAAEMDGEHLRNCQVATLFASDDSGFITGIDLLVDEGMAQSEGHWASGIWPWAMGNTQNHGVTQEPMSPVSMAGCLSKGACLAKFLRQKCKYVTAPSMLCIAERPV